MKFQATSYELLSKCDCTWSLNLLIGFGTRLSGRPAYATTTGESTDYLTCNPFLRAHKQLTWGCCYSTGICGVFRPCNKHANTMLKLSRWNNQK